MKTTYNFSDNETIEPHSIVFDGMPDVGGLVAAIDAHPVIDRSFTITSVVTS